MKRLLKRVLRTISRIAVFPLVLLYRCGTLTGPHTALFAAIGQLLALLPGKCGSFLRVAFYSYTADRVSPDAHIDFGSYLARPEVNIEERVYIGAYCIIGQCHIGPGTLVGSFVNILSGGRQHLDMDDDAERPIKSQAGQYVAVHIGADCWIGNNAVVMTDIGDHCIIGAASVVVKPIPANSVAVGNPCRVVKTRRGKQSQL